MVYIQYSWMESEDGQGLCYCWEKVCWLSRLDRRNVCLEGRSVRKSRSPAHKSTSAKVRFCFEG